MTEEDALFEAWLVRQGIRRDVARKKYIHAARMYRRFVAEREEAQKNATPPESV